MKKAIMTALAATTILSINIAKADDAHVVAYEHAPIGVMGDHMHEQGEWMTSYRFGGMSMDGSRQGTNDISTAQVLNQFMMSPVKMTGEMHMFGAMYGVTDDITLMVGGSYVEKEMTMQMRNGMQFKTKTKGFGDTKVSGLFRVFDEGGNKIQANLGVSLPTGSIDKRDDTPMGYNQLAYGMQLGSGTYDILPAVTYSGYEGEFGWGAQLSSVLRVGENDADYTLGNRYKLTAWTQYQPVEDVSFSLRLEAEKWGNIDGADARLNAMMSPGNRADMRGGERVETLVGVNYVVRLV